MSGPAAVTEADMGGGAGSNLSRKEPNMTARFQDVGTAQDATGATAGSCVKNC